MSKRPNAMDAIKQKVRQSGTSTVHSAIIDTNIISDDRKEIAGITPEKGKSDVDVNVHVNGDVNVNENVAEVAPLRERRPKFEDNHVRQTVWVRKEYVELIEKEALGERGEKTRIVNDALEQYFRKRKR